MIAAALGAAPAWAGVAGGAGALAASSLLPALLRRDAAATVVLTAISIGLGCAAACAAALSLQPPHPAPRWTVEKHPLLETGIGRG